MPSDTSFTIPASSDGKTLAAILREVVGNLTWSDARRVIAARRVRVNGNITLDDARRLKAGEVVEISDRPRGPAPGQKQVVIHYSDEDLIVVEKPPGIQSVRRHEERDWDPARKAKQPTFDELLGVGGGRIKEGRRVRPVHRLDQDTSGLMVFALAARAQVRLAEMFAAHEVRRVYTAVVHGRFPAALTIESLLVRDRGDGVRGSIPQGSNSPDAKRAVTHVQPIEHLADAYTVVECRLETGRTHQIRIHLAENEHMLCGEKVYIRQALGAAPQADSSHAPRHALHSSQLEFEHPITGVAMQFSSPLPRDLANWLSALRQRLGLGR